MHRVALRLISLLTAAVMTAWGIPWAASAEEATASDLQPAVQTEMPQDWKMYVEETVAPDVDQNVFSASDVPEGYTEPCETPGRVERVIYSFESDGEKQVKHVMVYLPAGYDEDTDRRYNVLYILHGSGGCMENYLQPDEATRFQNLLDHMIADGVIEPLIVVAASYYPANDRVDFMPLDMQVTYTAAFPTELTEQIIPAVEGTYRTWAESTDEEGIRLSRDHRGIAGFSLGGTAAWYVFIQKMEAFRWFLPISEASWDDGEGGETGIQNSDISARALYDAVLVQGYYRADFNLFVATGTDDDAFGITTSQMVSLLEYSDMFITGTNTDCFMMIGGLHTLKALYTYMYHILPKLFTV